MASASMTNPIYTANLIKASDGTKYKLKDVIIDLNIDHAEKEIAEKVTLNLLNIKVGTSRLSSLIALRDKLYVYANTGSGSKEVFSGIVWERESKDASDSRETNMICYDRSIYLMKSKDNLFVKKGKQTKDVITSLAKNWGFKISFKYKSITHGKLVYHSQYIADIIVDILEKVKSKTGVDYVIRMEKNVLVIDSVGTNTTIYKISKKENAIKTAYVQSMEDMVTKVKIVKAETVKKSGSDSETGKYLTVTSVKKNTDKYGTLQDIVVKEKDEKLSEAKKEAKEILEEHATPKVEVAVAAIDNPWVKKGDKVHISAGTLNNYYIVKGIEHDATEKIMYLEVKKA